MPVDRLPRLLCTLALTAFPVAAQAQVLPARPAPRIETVAVIPAPQGVRAQPTPAGVQLSWQAVAAAAQYVVVRAPNAATAGTPVGAVPAGTLTFLDRGFSAAASYQVAAVAADGRRGVSATVSVAASVAAPVAAPAPTTSALANRGSPATAAAPTAAPAAAAATPTGPFSQTGVSTTIFHVNGSAGVAFDGTTADLTVSDNMKVIRITVPLGNLSTGIALRDEHMKTHVLETAMFPNATFAIVRNDMKFPGSGAPTSGEVLGTFNVHGVGQATKVAYTATTDGVAIHVDASMTINTAHHGIAPVQYLGVKIDSIVTVRTSFSVKGN